MSVRTRKTEEVTPLTINSCALLDTNITAIIELAQLCLDMNSIKQFGELNSLDDLPEPKKKEQNKSTHIKGLFGEEIWERNSSLFL